MGGRLSLYELTQQWHEAKVTEARVSDTNLTVEVEASEGDIVTVTATSTDGVRYKGEYRPILCPLRTVGRYSRGHGGVRHHKQGPRRAERSVGLCPPGMPRRPHRRPW